MTDDLKERTKQAVMNVKKHLRITKVVCTRSVKGKYGDSYVGYSAAWDTIQDDAGGSADLATVQDNDQDLANHGGMTLKESKVASLLLGMQADVAAHDHAVAGGNISQTQHTESIKAIKHNYSRLIADLLGGDEPGNGGGNA